MTVGEKKPKSTWSDLKDLIENANKLAGLVAAVIAAITFASGNRLLSYIFILIACISIDWFLWQLITKPPTKKSEIIIAVPSGEIIKRVAGKNSIRRVLAGVVIFILTATAFGWIGVNTYQDVQQMQTDALRAQGYYAPTATPDEQLIILAEFDSAGSKKYDTTRRIREKLEEELQKANITNVRLIVTPKVSTKEEARALGERHKAVFVIWGWYDDAGITPNFTIIKESKQPLIKIETAEVIAEPARDFAVYISQGLPAQMSYFATFTIGQLYFWDEQYDRALGTFNIAVDNLEQSRRVEGIPLPPGTASLYFYRGYIYNTFKVQPDQAIADYTKAIELEPQSANAYNNRGITYYEKGNFDQAIGDYTKAIEIEPKHATAYNNRGNAYSNKGNLDQAIADYSKAIELEPRYARAYYNRGNANSNKGNLDQAITDYTKAIELDPKFVQAYYNRGNVYSDLGNLEQAIADFSKAIELDPKKADAYFNRGSVNLNKGNLDQAITDFTKAIELSPQDPDVYFGRGAAYKAKGDLDQAITDYSKAIELDPKKANPYINRGNIYNAQGKLDRAVADYSKAIELDPKNIFAYINRELVYRQNGMKSQAIADFEMYLRLAPNTPNRVQVEQWIQELKQP